MMPASQIDDETGGSGSGLPPTRHLPCAAMVGAARHLTPQGLLITYGPYLEDGVPTSAGNVAFDADLRQRNPAWGLRRREAVEAEAARAGLRLCERVAMPANNLLLVWGRSAVA